MKKKIQMRPAHVVQIVTPRKVVLNGLWLGPKKAKTVVVWVHGLGSSMFSKLFIADYLVDTTTAVLVFNNRGSAKVAGVPRAKGAYLKGGAAHEVFNDCVDDIEGALRFARSVRPKAIYLAEHSTGCQKSIYWASKKGRGVKGVIILAPMSDYSSERMAQGRAKLRRTERVARTFIKRNKQHDLLPENVWGWPWIADAQRFISLYSGDSVEEVFTYWDPKRTPKTLSSVHLPILVLLAEKDEYGDRPAKKIGDWFAEHLKIGDEVIVVPRVKHSFKGGERAVARAIHAFMKETR